VRALEARDRGIATIAEAVERASANAAPDAAAPDLEARVVIGGIYRMIATRLRRAETAIATLAEELAAWLSDYERAGGERRWQKLTATAKLGRSAEALEGPIEQMPSVLPPGRPRIPQQEIAENQRLRILHATVRLAASKGYMATTVADITKLARVRANTFYRQFADKQEAFTAVHELGFQQVMDHTAKAFFSVEGWPLRSWTAAGALTQLLDANPLLANVAFVEAYAVGPGAVQRIEDTHTAFMFFLQEGLAVSEEPPSRVAMEAIVASVFEVIYLQTRVGENGQIAGMAPYIAHLWLAPFLGARESDALIETQLRKQKAPAKAPRVRKQT
ncbi:MAG: TetR/AcrR family transcriptional regulator, partial [Solirubrobacterales bacterium]|nr:TetR/AcrR family transcriptional regulator [Solirubrobacterales bacterium]